MRFLFVLLLCVSCAYGQAPLWFTNLEEAYPKDTYVTFRGEGKNPSLSKSDALSRLSMYLDTKVKVETDATRSMTSDSKGSSNKQTLNQKVTISSSSDLNCVEYTDTYHSKANKKYYTLLYIDRLKYYDSIKKDLLKHKELFHAYYDVNNVPNFERIKLLTKSQEEGKAYLSLINSLKLINPIKDYDKDLEAIYSIPSKIEECRRHLYYNLLVINDYENLFASSIKKALNSSGFKEGEGLKVTFKLIDNVKGDKDGPYRVSLEGHFSIEEKGTVVYSQKVYSDESLLVYSLDKAHRLMCLPLSQKLQDIITWDLSY